MSIDSHCKNDPKSAALVHVDVCTAPASGRDLFRVQAAQLKTEHNHLMIVVHRPFIAFDKPTSASLAAHALCTTAARGNARLFEFCPVQPQMLVSPPASVP